MQNIYKIKRAFKKIEKTGGVHALGSTSAYLNSIISLQNMPLIRAWGRCPLKSDHPLPSLSGVFSWLMEFALYYIGSGCIEILNQMINEVRN